MRITVGADHAGVPLNEHAIAELRRLGHEVVDLGTHDPTQPERLSRLRSAVAEEVTSGRCATTPTPRTRESSTTI